MTIVEKLNKLKTQLASIKTAIQNKGVSVNDNISTWGESINSIVVDGEAALLDFAKSALEKHWIDFNYPIVIPNGVTTIRDYAFYSSTHIKEVIIPETVTNIHDYAFQGCSGLNKINIPSYVQALGTQCFYSCSSLTEITIPNSVVSIGQRCFSSCSSLTEITIPSSVTTVADGCFQSCSSLTEITIPSSVTYIGSDCFNSCTKLKNVIWDAQQQFIRGYTFKQCSSLQLLDLSSATQVFRFGSSATSEGVGSSPYYFHIHDGLQIVVPKSLYNEWKASPYWVNFVNYLYWRDDDGNLQNTPVE